MEFKYDNRDVLRGKCKRLMELRREAEDKYLLWNEVTP
jgi:hypothetical protein